jgi:hypothetical protein
VRWIARLAALVAMLAVVLGTEVASAPAAGTGATPVAVASSTASGGSGAALTVLPPAAVHAGDLLLASIAVTGGTGSVIPPSGWTEVPGAEAQITSTGVRTESFDTFAGASSPPAYTFTASGGGPTGWDAVITDVQGANHLSPVEVAAAQGNPSLAATVTAPSVSPTAAGAMVVFVGVGAPDATWVPPPGMTEQASVSGVGTGAVGEMVASETDSSTAPTGPVSATRAGSAPSAGVLIALGPEPARATTLATTQATGISSGNAILGTTALAGCSSGCEVWVRWRPASSAAGAPWTTGPSTNRSGQNVFEAYNLAAGTKYEYEACDNLSGAQCFDASGVADTLAAGSSPTYSTFTTLSCAAAQGGYGGSLTTGAVNFGAMPSYTCPPFADGAATAWDRQSPRNSSTPDPPVLANSATMVKDILVHGFSNISVGKDSTGWPVYYGSASDPVYTIVCSMTCPASTSVHVPAGVQAEDDADHHLSIVDQSGAATVEYDMWGVSSISPAGCHPCVIHALNAGSDPVTGDGEETGSGGVGADAAHDALQAGALRAEELFGEGFDQAAPQGLSIRHALAIAVPCTADRHPGNESYPAVGNDGMPCPSGKSGAPEMGQRFVLTAPIAQIDGSAEPQWKKNLLLALDYYGAIVVDTNGPKRQTSIRYQNDESYQLPSAADSVWGDPWMSFAAAGDDGTNITGYSPKPGEPDTVYSLNLSNDTWFENELSRYLVAVKPCVSLGDC